MTQFLWSGVDGSIYQRPEKKKKYFCTAAALGMSTQHNQLANREIAMDVFSTVGENPFSPLSFFRKAI